MQDFTISTTVTKKDYKDFLYASFYKKPKYILITLLGVYLIATVILNYYSVIDYYHETPYFEMIAGLFILLFPTIIVQIAAKGYHSNPSFQYEMNYTFGEDGIVIKGLTFQSILKWTHIVKQKESKNYLLLFSSNKLGNFIDKSKLTQEQIEFIKSKVPNK